MFHCGCCTSFVWTDFFGYIKCFFSLLLTWIHFTQWGVFADILMVIPPDVSILSTCYCSFMALKQKCSSSAPWIVQTFSAYFMVFIPSVTLWIWSVIASVICDWLSVCFALYSYPFRSDAPVGEAKAEGGDGDGGQGGWRPPRSRPEDAGQADLRGLPQELQHEQGQGSNHSHRQDQHPCTLIVLWVGEWKVLRVFVWIASSWPVSSLQRKVTLVLQLSNLFL